MEVIKQNPFRVLALPLTASERDIAKRINELLTFAEFGKTKDYHTDFGFISSLDRSLDVIKEAAKAIELPEKKLYHSLFWFWANNSVDDLVFDVLKDGDSEQAIALWHKTVTGEITAKNYSNARNLSLLYLILAAKDERFNQDMFFSALDLSSKVFSHDELDAYSEEVSGAAHFSKSGKVQKFFIDQIIRIYSKFISTDDGAGIKKLLDVFRSFPADSYQYAAGKFINKPTYEVEAAVEETANKRKAAPDSAFQAAKDLIKKTETNLFFLKEVLSESDMRYQMVADKVAGELLHCSTDFYNSQIKNDDSLSPHQKARVISLDAGKIAIGSRKKAEIEEDIKLINDLIAEKKCAAQIESHVTSFNNIINRLPKPDGLSREQITSLPVTIKKFFSDSKILIEKLRAEVGDSHPAYIYLVNTAVGISLSLSIKYANETSDCTRASEILKLLDPFSRWLEPDLRDRLQKNGQIIRQNVLVHIANATNSAKAKSGGCYIATMVYGDYDAPEVKILRKYRDNVLARHTAGKLFIKIYYQLSPLFVTKFGNNRALKNLIRKVLSRIIKGLSK